MQPYCRTIPNHATQMGFSLLELAVVLVIIAVMTGSGMVVGKATMENAQVATTNTRILVIQNALLSFRRANERIPCPGNATLLATDVNYGKESANAGSCVGGTPAANYSAITGASTVVEGSIPTKTLSLPDEYMYDGWGRKFAYSVWANSTSAHAFVNYGVSSNCGMGTVRNSVGMARSNNAVYTLVSFGPNGHGAYNERGQRITSQSTNTDELINCHCNSAGADTGYLGTYVEKDFTENPNAPLDKFDDIVRYQERWQLQNYFDEYNPGGYLICPSTGPGLRSYGTAVGVNAGYAEVVGDINGDGYQDLIIGMPNVTSGDPGKVAVVFGQATGLVNPLPLSGLNGTNGLVMSSIEAGDWAGAALAIGDVNNDNIPDLIIGAPRSGLGNGKVYVVYGHTGPWTPALNLSTLLVTQGFSLTDDVVSGSPEYFGSSVAAGDLNNDNATDFVVGAPGATSDAGAVYIMQTSGATIPVSNLLSTMYTGKIDGGIDDRAGTAVQVADVNGDGIDDLMYGSPGDGSTMPGQVTVHFGKRIGWRGYYRGYWGYNGYRIFGESNGDEFGYSLSTADVDGDIRDIIIGAPGFNSDRGAAYVYFGTAGRKPPHRPPGFLNGINGVRMDGVTAGDRAGTAVAGIDVDGDGYGDVAIGAPGASPGGLAGAGSTYVVFGHPGWTSTFALSGINGTNGFILNGSTAGDGTGTTLAVGDVNHDYIADLLVGAPFADYTLANSGVVYSYYGERKPKPFTLLVDLNSL